MWCDLSSMPVWTIKYAFHPMIYLDFVSVIRLDRLISRSGNKFLELQLENYLVINIGVIFHHRLRENEILLPTTGLGKMYQND